jgi:hypothetical protein
MDFGVYFGRRKDIFALYFGKMWIFSHNTRHCPDGETYVPEVMHAFMGAAMRH